MDPELALVLKMRKAFGRIREGSGSAQAVVRELRSDENMGRKAAHMILLGYPMSVSLEELRRSGYEEISMLATLVGESSASTGELVGTAGESLSMILERWIKAKENNRMEEKVHRFRGLIASGVLGGVMAMMATLGPLVGSISFSGVTQTSTAGYALYSGGAMATIGSAMLGYFTARKGMALNVVVSVVAFIVVAALASPLVEVSAPNFWGVK